MLGIGFWELLLLAVVALVVIGPQGLPQAAADLGRTYRKAKKMLDDFLQELSAETPVTSTTDDMQRLDVAPKSKTTSATTDTSSSD